MSPRNVQYRGLRILWRAAGDLLPNCCSVQFTRSIRLEVTKLRYDHSCGRNFVVEELVTCY